MKTTIKILVVGFLAGFLGAYVLLKVNPPEVKAESGYQFARLTTDSDSEMRNTATDPVVHSTSDPSIDFSQASSKAIPSVVFIKCSSESSQGLSYWEMLFGGGSQTRVSSGSGVIFSSDGYIVTNNHVVDGAETIEVQYNKKAYDADLIGIDPSTDLAVLKINASGLPAITAGSSKDLQVGEWVLAVGNPYSLSSTVTAGIVSAKGRRIGILEDKFPIESFIQTDAAINPGNSGGALVNRNGDLVGINSAILSKTGSYTGYAFAIPVDIVKKVFSDLIKFGVVQKALVGGSVTDYNFETAKRYRLSTNVAEFKGVLLEQVDDNGPADKAGLKPGDIITGIDGVPINSQSAFEEILSYHYPGDKITLTYLRDGDAKTATLTLVNRNGATDVFKNIIHSDKLGAELKGTVHGVQVFDIKSSGYFGKLELPENFTIEEINNVDVKDPQDVIDFFDRYRGRAIISGKTQANEPRALNFILR